MADPGFYTLKTGEYAKDYLDTEASPANGENPMDLLNTTNSAQVREGWRSVVWWMLVRSCSMQVLVCANESVVTCPIHSRSDRMCLSPRPGGP